MMKRVWNNKKGHYILVKEDENVQQPQQVNNQSPQQNTGQNQEQQDDNQQPQKSFKSVYQENDIMSFDSNIQKTKKEGDDKVIQLQTQLRQVKEQIKQEIDNGKVTGMVYNPSEVDPRVTNLELKILQTQMDNFSKLNQLYVDRMKKIQSFAGISEAMISKYGQYLTESKIAACKIYIDPIIDTEDRCYREFLFPSKVDFNKLFKDTGMIYGSDKKGWFVLCVDSEDVEQMTDILVSIGIEKRDIDTYIETVMYQRAVSLI